MSNCLGSPWTAACQAPLSTEFFRLEYWSGLPFLPSGDLPNPGIEPVSPSSPALADGLYHWATSEALFFCFFRYTVQLIILFKVFLCFSQIKVPRLRTGWTLPRFQGGPGHSLSGSVAPASTKCPYPSAWLNIIMILEHVTACLELARQPSSVGENSSLKSGC